MDQEELRRLLGEDIYLRARRYHVRGRVSQFMEEESEPGVRYLTAQVGGKESYAVQVWLREDGTFLSGSCTCSYNQNGEGQLCKHIGAVLLQDMENEQANQSDQGLESLLNAKTVTRGTDLQNSRSAYTSNLDMLFGTKWRGQAAESDQQAQKLLERYRMEAQLETPQILHNGETQPESIHLEPELTPDPLRRNAAPELRLRIRGTGRSYIVKDIDAMLSAIANEETVRYGAELEFTHTLEAFDTESRELLRLLRRQRELLDYAGEMVRGAGRMTLRRSSTIPLAPNTCDELYEMYYPTGQLSGWLMPEKAPRLTLVCEKKQGGVTMRVTPGAGSFDGSRSTYFFTEDTIWRCKRRKAKKLIPVLDSMGDRDLFFTTKDAAEFCSYVLPEIREFLDIQDPDRALLDQIPLTPVVQYYLDAPELGTIDAYVQFVYGEDTVSPYHKYDHSFLRDDRTETQAVTLLAQYMEPEVDAPAGLYQTADQQAIETFLEDGVPALLAQGEVYLTDAFRAMEAPRPKITVGVSVQGNLLDLDLDTGEFPAQELRALLDSLRAKKRYHRLRDGRLLRLDGSLDTLEGLDEMLMDSGMDLSAGHTSLPLYRAPSLDKALSGQNGIGFSRDDAFRRISRSFHSIADADFALPESLQSVLRRYQRTGYRWLRMLDQYGMGGILADDMGLGKTLQVLAYLLAKKQEGVTQPSLIVCPASLVLNWAEEAARFVPELRVRAIDGDAAYRAALVPHFQEYDLIVTGYDLLRRDIDTYDAQDFYACILDEAQAIKNQTTQKYKAVCRVKSQVRFALTGTPIENRLSELWSIFSFLMPGYLYSYTVFRERFEKPIVLDGSEATTRRLNQLTSPFILRRMKTEVLKELPPKLEYVRHVQMDTEQRKLYLAAVLDAKEKIGAAGPQDRIQALAALTRLRQICCDPRLAMENWNGESAKLDSCMELIRTAVDGGHQILLFSQFTSMLDLIRNRLEEEEISSFTLQGSTPKAVRAELVRRFNTGEASVFLISLKAGGTGLNLTAADIVIHYDPWWNVAAQNQATDRAYRIGQKSTVQVYKLITQNTVEEKILDLQAAKQDLADKVTGSAEGSILNMTPQEILQLLEA